MTKKQYFMMLWPFSCMPAIISLVRYGYQSMFSFSSHDSLISFLIHPFFAIAMHTVALVMGFYFAQQIGARLLFLQEDYDFKDDVLKPALLAGSLYVTVALLINTIMPLGELYFDFSSYVDIAESFFNTIFYKIRFDLFGLLFGLCGSVFAIKKIAKDVSLSVIMSICIVVISVLPVSVLLFDCFGRFGCAASQFMGLSFGISNSLLLGILFWKKGLETAMLYEVIVCSILYLIVPVIILALKA